MRRDGLEPIDRAALTTHVRRALQRYWPAGDQALDRVARVQVDFPSALTALTLVDVPLPAWAVDCGVDGRMLVPREACADPRSGDWTRVDWWLAAFLLLECWHERAWEQRHGVVHSYSFRLRGWDERVWQRAWVNRIALFLRAWAARETGQGAVALFGSLPAPEIVLTHDVDAITKTLPIRLKQSAFMGVNAIRLMGRTNPRLTLMRAKQALRFAFGRDDWSVPDAIVEIERQAGVRSQFNFYADDRAKNFERWLFDPAYDVASEGVRERLAELVRSGWRIGLHPSFDAWQSAATIGAQRERLQSFVPAPITGCRQHWLRFSWRDTWAAQSAGGLSQDMTLMFNDRPGLRGSSALCWQPWNPLEGRAHSLSALPTMLMDSHVYDYQPMSPSERRSAFEYWISEVVAVGGQVAVLWHPHTLTRDYGWTTGFLELLSALKARVACEGL